MTNESEPVTITPCPDGPLLVRGDFRIAPAPGRPAEAPGRKVVALCRCGKSGIPPMCDGSHKLVGFRAPAPEKSAPENPAPDREPDPGDAPSPGE